MTPTLTEDQAMAALGDFIVDILPGLPVAQGLDNRVPQPRAKDYVFMTPGGRGQLATTTHEYRPSAEALDIGRSTSLTVQVDFYGPTSSDHAQVFTTLLRDEFGCAKLASAGVQPLYCADPQQMPLVDGEKQYERRWMVSTVLQFNPAVSTPMEFADKVTVTLQEAD